MVAAHEQETDKQAINRADCSRAVHGFRGTCGYSGAVDRPLAANRRGNKANSSFKRCRCSRESNVRRI